jgi:hypothetical protein
MNQPTEAEAVRDWPFDCRRITSGWHITYRSPCGLWALDKMMTDQEVQYHVRLQDELGIK